MGRMTDRLRREFQSALAKKIVPLAAIQKAQGDAESMPDMEALIRDGHDPLHAAYKHTMNLLTFFGEKVVEAPFLHRVYDFLLKAQDTLLVSVRLSSCSGLGLSDLVLAAQQQNVATEIPLLQNREPRPASTPENDQV